TGIPCHRFARAPLRAAEYVEARRTGRRGDSKVRSTGGRKASRSGESLVRNDQRPPPQPELRRGPSSSLTSVAGRRVRQVDGPVSNASPIRHLRKIGMAEAM